MKPKQMARRVMEKYGTRDPFQLSEYMNLMVFETDLGKSVKGIITRDDGWLYVCLNSNLVYEEKRIVLAHEIGHAICHKHLNCYFMIEHTLNPVGRYEREANEFASELLICDDALREVREEGLEYAAKVLGVTEELLLLKY